MRTQATGEAGASDGHWEGSVMLTPCGCILCRMAIDNFQMPPHMPDFTFGETVYISESVENES